MFIDNPVSRAVALLCLYIGAIALSEMLICLIVTDNLQICHFYQLRLLI